MKFEVSKHLKVVYTLEADGPDTALAAEPPADATITVIRQRARDLDKQPAGIRTITDRQLRPGRRLIAHYKGTEWIAEVQDDGLISLRRKGHPAQTFASLAKAATSIIDGKAVNAWFLFHDPAAKEKLAAGPPKPEPEQPTESPEPEEPSEAAPTEAPTEPAAKPKGKGAKKS